VGALAGGARVGRRHRGGRVTPAAARRRLQRRCRGRLRGRGRRGGPIVAGGVRLHGRQGGSQ
ncbi:unnamed protein product, partial [Ectocarpus fasciculatus]